MKRKIIIFNKTLIPIILFIILPSVFTAYADYVTPSDRVTSHLNIREQPSANSAIVGKILVEEKAELIESIPRYYKILHQGITGYVSKGWSTLVPVSVSLTTFEKESDLIIGSWNIKWFGNKPEDKHNYQRIGDIISRFDVVAIQGLRGENFIDRLDKIVAELKGRNLKYIYLYSNETGYKGNPDKGHPTVPKNDYLERYAFMWDTDRIDLIEFQGGAKYRFVSLPAINNSIFRQVPIYANFKVKDGNGFDFRILTTHTVYKKALNEVRKTEIHYIHFWMMNQVRRGPETEKNIIAIGDFNANPSGQPHHFKKIISGTNQYRVIFQEPIIAGESTLRTTIQQTDNPTNPDYFKNPVYDHALVSHETSYALPSNNMTRSAKDLGVIEFDQEDWVSEYETWNDLINAMSDHRPIWFKMDYNAQDYD